MNEREVARLISKALKEMELLRVGNRSYINAFKYPESRFDIKDLMPNGNFPQALDPSPMLQPLQDPSKRFFDQVVVPPTYLIFQYGGKIYAKNGSTGQIDFSGTDATTVIQSAINALPEVSYTELNENITAKAGKIYIKSGFYDGVSINIPAGSVITLEGEFPVSVSDSSVIRSMMAAGTILKGNPDKEAIIDVPRLPYSYVHTKLAIKNIALLYEFPTTPLASRYILRCRAFQLLLQDVAVYSNMSGTGTAPVYGICLEGEPASDQTFLVRVSAMRCWYGIYVFQEHVAIDQSVVADCLYGILVGWRGCFKRGGIRDTQLFNNVYDFYCTGPGSEIHLDSVLLEHSGVPSGPVVVTNGRKLIVSALKYTPHTMTLDKIFSNLNDVVFLTPTISCHNPYAVLVVKNWGSATIPAGSTYVDVSHGLSLTPDMNRIKVTPKDNLGGRSFWVSDVTSTTFRINISSADTVDHSFGWSYE